VTGHPLDEIEKVVGCRIDGLARSPTGRPGILCSDDRGEFVVWQGGDARKGYWMNVVEHVGDGVYRKVERG
jgi:hypothetical protein